MTLRGTGSTTAVAKTEMIVTSRNCKCLQLLLSKKKILELPCSHVKKCENNYVNGIKLWTTLVAIITLTKKII